MTRTMPRVSNASQSPVPVGIRPIERHLYIPRAIVKILHPKKASFCRVSVEKEVGSEFLGAKDVNASKIKTISRLGRVDDIRHT